MIHFARFAKFDQRYWNAVRVFGPPVFMHQLWDRRAQREIAEGDTVVFAKGEHDQDISPYNGDDEFYEHRP